MKQIKLFAALLLTAALLTQCSKDETTVDTGYPEISTDVAGAFPVQCSELQRGQSFTFKATFTDNVELGSFSLDIHHNFDHHNHSTEVNSCNMEAIKAAVKPMVFIQTYDIPAGLKTYTPTVTINIPADVDPGDYHFLVRVVDREGWPVIKGLSVKIK
jgi:hypothetical protein